MKPYYALRLVAGLTFLAGTGLMAWNLFKTVQGGKVVVARVPEVPEEWRVASAPAQAQEARA